MKRTKEAAIQILLVSPNEEDRHQLGEILRHPEYCIHHARSAQEAGECLAANEVSVVLSESGLPGGWRRVFNLLRDRPRPPRLIVTARNAGARLWAEVLNLGAFDVLDKPWGKRELRHAVRTAFDHWRLYPARA